MKRPWTLIGAFVLAAMVGPAGQQASAAGGSLYSILGFGDMRYTVSARSAGMGYTGIAVSDSNFISGLSPATWGSIDRTRFEAGMLYEGFKSTDGNTSRYLARLDFSGALLALPISPDNGITVVGGFLPYSSVNYDAYGGGAYTSPIDSVGYTVHQVGRGGLDKGMIGLSYSPSANLAVGASLDYLFGTIRTTRTLTLPSSSLAGGTTDRVEALSGLVFTLGVRSHDFGWLTDALRPLSVGVVASTRGNMHTRTQDTFVYTYETDTSTETRGRSVVPLAYGIGLAYQLSEQWSLAADYAAQQWSTSEFNGVVPGNLRNSRRFGIGAEMLPTRVQGLSWLKRMAYRVGFSWNATYAVLDNQPINEWVVTAGLDIPIGYQQRIVVAGEYGGRGTTAGGLVKDKIFRLSFSLNLSEPWFVRYEED